MRKLFVFLLAAAGLCQAETAGDVNPDEIIRRFVQKESEFKQARSKYTYRQTVKLVELDADSNPTDAKYELVEDVVFTPEGKRTERVVRAPPNKLKNLILMPEDEQDLRDIQPYTLTADAISSYDIRYLGKQQVDEINCYTFAVKPKTMEKGKRYFEGQIWVDDQDLQIVKSYGRGTGIIKKGTDSQFPKFETYRQQIDGKFWFPVYTISNDTLHFHNGLDQRIKMTVKYEDYKQFKSESTIEFGDEVERPGEKPTTAPQAPKPKP